jgi:hypothetical protein
MAVENVVATPLTGIDAQPKVVADASVFGGRLLIATGIVQMAKDASATSTYKMLRMPKNAVIHELEYLCDNADSPGDADFGEVGTDYAAALNEAEDMAHGAWTDILLDDVAIADRGKELWELLGYTNEEDAPAQIDLGWTITDTNDTAATNLIVRCFYSLG